VDLPRSLQKRLKTGYLLLQREVVLRQRGGGRIHIAA